MQIIQTMRDLQQALTTPASAEARWQQALAADRALPNGLEIVVTHTPDHGPELRRRLDATDPERLLSVAATAPDLLVGLDDIVARWVDELAPGGLSEAGRGAALPSSGRPLSGPRGPEARTHLTERQVEARVRALLALAPHQPLTPAQVQRLVRVASTPFTATTSTRSGASLRLLLAQRHLTEAQVAQLETAWRLVPGTRLLLALHPSAATLLPFGPLADAHPEQALDLFRTSRHAWKTPAAKAWLKGRLSDWAGAEAWGLLRRWALAGRTWIADGEMQPHLLEVFSGEGGLQLSCLLQLTEGQIALALPNASLKRLLMDPRPEVRELAMRAMRQTATARQVLAPETQTPAGLRAPVRPPR